MAAHKMWSYLNRTYLYAQTTRLSLLGDSTFSACATEHIGAYFALTLNLLGERERERGEERLIERGEGIKRERESISTMGGIYAMHLQASYTEGCCYTTMKWLLGELHLRKLHSSH